MTRLCRLFVIAVLCASALAEPAAAQSRQRGRPGSEEKPTVEELLRRLDELEGRMERPAPARDGGLAMMLEDVRLTNTDFYNATGIRYFSARLLVINLTDKPVSIPTSRIVLSADRHKHTLAEARVQLSRSMLQIGEQIQRFPEIAETLEAPPHGTASTWLVYAGIDTALNVPALQLKVDWDGGSEELDINQYERGVLGLRTERLGPDDSCALLTIHGELNSVNAGTLVEDLETLSAKGVMRAVVAWGESSVRPDDQLLGWLAIGTGDNSGMQYAQLPRLPITIREFHAVKPAGDETREHFAYGAQAPMHQTVADAVDAALRSAFGVVPQAMLREELSHGHPLSRAAALKHAGARFSPRDLPLVLAACDDPDELVRRQALGALGQFRQPAAVERLMHAAESDDRELADAALHSLAGSRYPEAHEALVRHIDALDDSASLNVIDILASHPREAWIDRIAGYYQSSNPDVQLAALRALVRLGHPEIVSFLEDALASSNPQLQADAFVQLAQRTDPRSEELALEHALKSLESGPPDSATHTLLLRTREQRALSPLLRHLDAMSQNRESMIELIAQIGGANVMPELRQRYPEFSTSEQATALDEMLSARMDGLRPMALAALSSGDPQLMEVAARILTARPDPETVPLLAKALDEAESIDAWSTICNALANVGDVEARAVLMAARKQDDRARRDQVVNALTRIKHTSPAHQYVMQATQESEADQQEKARKLLDLAIIFDPEYSDAYSQRGHLLLLQEKYAESRQDFDRASELDPYNSLAITGRAIATVMQGDVTGGVEQIVASADKFSGDALFEYNSACVYGRAVEALQDDPDDAGRERRDEYQNTALEHLRQSIELGFSMPEFIKQDPDLAVLHNVPEFQELLKERSTSKEEGGDTIDPDGAFELNGRPL